MLQHISHTGMYAVDLGLVEQHARSLLHVNELIASSCDWNRCYTLTQQVQGMSLSLQEAREIPFELVASAVLIGAAVAASVESATHLAFVL